MKAQLIKQKFKMGEYNTYGYKIKQVSYCCDDLNENPLFEWSMENIDENGVPIPSLRQDVEESEWGETYEYSNYFDISFCPFCGEPIGIEVIGEEDITELYREIESERNSVNKKYMKTDSKKKEARYGSVRNQLDTLINHFHILCDYKNEEDIRGELLRIRSSL